MAVYYALKTGQSWYQSFGYQYDKQQYEEDERRPLETSPLDVEDPVAKLIGIGHSQLRWSSWSLRSPLSLYQDHLGGRRKKLNSDFALWVWENHCSQWPTVVEGIFGEIPKRVLNRPMTKHLACDSA